MRILAWMQTHFPMMGGIQTAARHLFPALVERGHEAIVVTSHFGEQLPDRVLLDGIAVHRFPFHDALWEQDAARIVREGQRAAKLVRDFAPDVIHVQGFGPNLFFLLKIAQSQRIPFLLTLHEEDSNYFQDAHGASLLTRLLHEAGRVTTVSQLEANRLAALLPAIASKIRCVYQGLPAPTLPRQPLPREPRLLCLGRLAEVKNFALAVRAFSRIAPAFPNARLLFAGDGPERSHLEQVVDDLQLRGQVEFLGWIEPEQVPHIINQASAVVLPSRSEGLPLVGVEAAYMARPLLATNVNGCAELVTDGETGLLVPSEDEAALAAAMHKLLSDPALLARLGEAAHARVADRFALTTMADNFSKLYAAIIAEARPIPHMNQ